jgi:hypothetical protein
MRVAGIPSKKVAFVVGFESVSVLVPFPVCVVLIHISRQILLDDREWSNELLNLLYRLLSWLRL